MSTSQFRRPLLRESAFARAGVAHDNDNDRPADGAMWPGLALIAGILLMVLLAAGLMIQSGLPILIGASLVGACAGVVAAVLLAAGR